MKRPRCGPARPCAFSLHTVSSSVLFPRLAFASLLRLDFDLAAEPVASCSGACAAIDANAKSIVVMTPADLMVTTIPTESGEAWIIMQNKGQVDVSHATRERALSRAHEVAAALRGRVFLFENERLTEHQP